MGRSQKYQRSSGKNKAAGRLGSLVLNPERGRQNQVKTQRMWTTFIFPRKWWKLGNTGPTQNSCSLKLPGLWFSSHRGRGRGLRCRRGRECNVVLETLLLSPFLGIDEAGGLICVQRIGLPGNKHEWHIMQFCRHALISVAEKWNYTRPRAPRCQLRGSALAWPLSALERVLFAVCLTACSSVLRHP